MSSVLLWWPLQNLQHLKKVWENVASSLHWVLRSQRILYIWSRRMLVTKVLGRSSGKHDYMQRKIIFDNLLRYLVSSRGRLLRTFYPWVCHLKTLSLLQPDRTEEEHPREDSTFTGSHPKVCASLPVMPHCLKQPGVPSAHWCWNDLAQLCTKDQKTHLFAYTASPLSCDYEPQTEK